MSIRLCVTDASRWYFGIFSRVIEVRSLSEGVAVAPAITEHLVRLENSLQSSQFALSAQNDRNFLKWDGEEACGVCYDFNGIAHLKLRAQSVGIDTNSELVPERKYRIDFPEPLGMPVDHTQDRRTDVQALKTEFFVNRGRDAVGSPATFRRRRSHGQHNTGRKISSTTAQGGFESQRFKPRKYHDRWREETQLSLMIRRNRPNLTNP
jgi:hypothetical protein